MQFAKKTQNLMSFVESCVGRRGISKPTAHWSCGPGLYSENINHHDKSCFICLSKRHVSLRSSFPTSDPRSEKSLNLHTRCVAIFPRKHPESECSPVTVPTLRKPSTATLPLQSVRDCHFRLSNQLISVQHSGAPRYN